MPSPAEILDNLAYIANHWRWLAIAWHGYLLVVVVLIAIGVLRSRQLVAAMLIAPVASVSAVAWTGGNPFNGLMFGALAFALAASLKEIRGDIRLATPFAIPGVALLMVGAAYPHFVRVESWTEYICAAPIGLLPCPTVALLTGATLTVSLFEDRRWARLVMAAALVYGFIGLFHLSVNLDAALIIAAGVVMLARFPNHRSRDLRIDRSTH